MGKFVRALARDELPHCGSRGQARASLSDGDHGGAAMSAYVAATTPRDGRRRGRRRPRPGRGIGGPPLRRLPPSPRPHLARRRAGRDRQRPGPAPSPRRRPGRVARARRRLRLVRAGPGGVRPYRPRPGAQLHRVPAPRPARPRRRGRRRPHTSRRRRVGRRQPRLLRRPHRGGRLRLPARAPGRRCWRSRSPCCTAITGDARCVDGGRPAGLVLGLGLVGDALLRELVAASSRPETWIAVDHPVEFAAAAVLVALAGTRRTAFDVIDVRADSLAQLTTTVAGELGAPDLRIALSDGAGGWLHPGGEAWGTAPPAGTAVDDASGTPCAVLEGCARRSRSPPRSRTCSGWPRPTRGCDARSSSRSTSSTPRAASALGGGLGTRLARRAAPYAGHRARRHHGTRAGPLDRSRRRPRASDNHAPSPRDHRARHRPLGPGRITPEGAGRRSGNCAVRGVVERCDEPRSPDVARALWFCGAEAASNTAKHGLGAALRVSVRRSGETVLASFVDDGPGGADPSGAGIRGLADRVETLGGTLHLSSPPNGGTRLRSCFPTAPTTVGSHRKSYRETQIRWSPCASYGQGDRLPGGTP